MVYGELKIRSYDVQIHRARVEDLERRCEVGPTKRVVLFTDTMGDPICRIKNSPMYKMLVRAHDTDHRQSFLFFLCFHYIHYHTSPIYVLLHPLPLVMISY